ncbi:hypothetical protein GE115_09085 [Agromyces sp. CFH 90414]|uniref:Uncharacterized protein n=2 Tax=Agromyces agglutinans TaxID=2662258 RepID=A0A6I2F6S1_9MICO|nr:hypothetical protein [Agromyces agglutinans]
MTHPTRVIRIDYETDRMVGVVARLLRRTKKDLVDAAVSAYVAAHRERIEVALAHASERIDEVRDPDIRDPRTGLTRAEAADLFPWNRD